jgi:OOP family OmpA-OmpF porin
VPDREDACLKEPGKRNADPKKNGCPVGAVVNGQLVLDQVKFKTDSAVILPESNETLGQVLEAIRRLPDTNRYRVEGHTDSMGKPEYNKGLSQRRAQSVVQWFVQKGIPAKRFEAKGYGQEKPLASNATEAGRQANRRVEIHILEGTNQLPARPAPAK